MILTLPTLLDIVCPKLCRVCTGHPSRTQNQLPCHIRNFSYNTHAVDIMVMKSLFVSAYFSELSKAIWTRLEGTTLARPLSMQGLQYHFFMAVIMNIGHEATICKQYLYFNGQERKSELLTEITDSFTVAKAQFIWLGRYFFYIR